MKESATVEGHLQYVGVLSGAEVCKSCRSRKMLKNDAMVAKISADTAENEPGKE